MARPRDRSNGAIRRASGGPGWKKDCDADFVDGETYASDCCRQLVRCAEPGCTPQSCAKPTAYASARRPVAPLAEITDHQPTAGAQHARHFPKGNFGIRDEGEDRDAGHHIKGLISIRQNLRPSDGEIDMASLAHGLRMCASNHSCVWITAGHASGAVLQHVQGECPVATADIENREAVQPPCHVEDELAFQCFGDLPE